ncbi:MAG TPA: hypothetical protein VFO29_04105 [Candidatus Rubrimentiphilum sp.]|nr:hypothetical protein [Candidatus Rubrimentiphilum sp.]
MANSYTLEDIMTTLIDLRDATALGFANLRAEMSDRFEHLEDKINRRFDSVDLRFDAFERRVSVLEQR